MLLALMIAGALLASPSPRSTCDADMISGPSIDDAVWTPPAKNPSGLRIEAWTRSRRVQMGGTVEIQMIIVNENAHPVGLLAGPRVYKARATWNEVVVWEYPPALPPLPYGQIWARPGGYCLRTLAPAERLVLGVTWALRGDPLPPGTYVLHQSLEMPGMRASAPPLRVTVLPPEGQSRPRRGKK